MNDAEVYKRQDLLEIYKNPSNKGVIDGATVSIVEENPLCGDVLTLDLLIEDKVIKNAKFSGDHCAVSVISAEYLLEEVIGRDLKYAKSVDKEKLLALIGIELTTSRVRCATLILDALKNALKKYDKK